MKGIRFEVFKGVTRLDGTPQFFVRILAQNNRIQATTEAYNEEESAFRACADLWVGFIWAVGAQDIVTPPIPFTRKSLKPGDGVRQKLKDPAKFARESRT